MFFKGSRYKDLPEAVTIEKTGLTARSKSLRWIPSISGEFLHTVSQKDRLDLLAYKYYKNSEKWWLICDANLDFCFPTDILDFHSILRETFTIEKPAGIHNWPLLISRLKELRGICDVKIDIESNSLNNDIYSANLYVVYNLNELERQTIVDTIVLGDEEYTIRNSSKDERIGQKIIIPPNQLV